MVGCSGVRFEYTSSHDGGSVITGYDIRYRFVSADGTYHPWDIHEVRGTHLSHDEPMVLGYFATINPGEYVLIEFSARVWNSVGAGPWSDTATYEDFDLLICERDAGNGDDVGSRTIPLGVSAIPGDGFVTLSWNAPSSDGGSPITTYEVGYRRAGQNNSYYTKTTSATSIKITGLVNDVDYEMFVRARNAYGASSWTETLQARPVGSQGSELAAELLELINFLDEVLGLIDGDETPTVTKRPLIRSSGTVHEAKSTRQNRLHGGHPRRRAWQIVATESWKLRMAHESIAATPVGKSSIRAVPCSSMGVLGRSDGSRSKTVLLS